MTSQRAQPIIIKINRRLELKIAKVLPERSLQTLLRTLDFIDLLCTLSAGPAYRHVDHSLALHMWTLLIDMVRHIDASCHNVNVLRKKKIWISFA